MRFPIWLGLLFGVCLGRLDPAWSADMACRRFLVEDRVHVSLVFRADGQAGEISWLDTVSGRRGDNAFETADEAVLQVEMPGGWCAQARFVSNVALLIDPPPWNPETHQVALGVSLD